MSSYPEAELCKMCEYALSSHWVAKQSTQPTGTDNVDRIFGDDENASSSDDSAFFSEGDTPDWVTVALPEDRALGREHTYRSPPHYSFVDLEKSAKQGCYLCIIFWDKVHDEICRLTAEKKESVDRLQGVVVARPNFDDSFEGEIVQLEIIYYVDGLIESGTYAMTVGVIFYKLLSEEIVTEESYQPPLFYEVSKDPLTRSISRMKQWLSTCDNHHQGCKQAPRSKYDSSNSQLLPTRLLRLRHGTDMPNVFLCNTESIPPHTRYATLSHCWGMTQPVKLLLENCELFSQNIDFSSLPKTFQDAIILSLALDMEYIWIDSLCIIQNSRSDWLHEASLMYSVYSNSWINIAATSSLDGTGGLFHNSVLVKNCAIDTTWTGLPSGKYLCVDETAWQRRVENAPLNQRGWVFQERMLSPRTLHCAYDQIWWTCRELPSCCETFPTGALTLHGLTLPSLANLYESNNDDFISWNEAWLSIVKSYTKAQLTYGSDKLIAFGGIAQEVQRSRRVPETDYLAGLWRGDLVVDLLWRMASSGTRNETAPYRAPTWSWASVDGEVYFHASEKRKQARENTVVEILDCHMSTESGWFGPVSDGWLEISGPIFTITLRDVDTSSSGESVLQELSLDDKSFTNDEGFAEALDDDDLYKDWPIEGKQLFYGCLKATKEPDRDSGEYVSEGLILEQAKGTGGKKDGYERVGWLRIFHESEWVTKCDLHKRSYTLW